MMKDNLKKTFLIVDEEGTVVGKATRGECHNGARLLHAAVYLHVFNVLGDMYLQKHLEWKDIQPGKWDTAVGGHIEHGRSMEETHETIGQGVLPPNFENEFQRYFLDN